MSDDVVIRAEGLGKKYVIGHEERERYVALRDVMARTAKSVWRKTADMARGRPIIVGDRTEDFWALKDVSFEVRRGEVLGVIGRNGAGKSTLLKVLSRITEPTEGRVTIEGRVASLLEVGTGFHPELTGRENVYLNGAILGMTRAEIKRKFDEIVDFAGVERFLDTPVKRYSSGMQVRLAFAVAAHLEPEILVVDEVLAVGDAEFQKKCLGKMGDVASRGRTVLFVSHNLAAVRGLCSAGILLNDGSVSTRGAVGDVLSSYIGGFADDSSFMSGAFAAAERKGKSQQFHLSRVSVRGAKSNRIGLAKVDEPVAIEIAYEQSVPLHSSRIIVLLRNGSKDIVFASTDESARAKADRGGSCFVSSAIIPSKLLRPGNYSVEVRAAIPNLEVLFPNTEVCGFRVDGPILNGARIPPDRWQGVICPAIEWSVAREAVSS